MGRLCTFFLIAQLVLSVGWALGDGKPDLNDDFSADENGDDTPDGLTVQGRMDAARKSHTGPYATLAASPAFLVAQKGKFGFDGFVGERLRVNEEEWLLKVAAANPAMMEIFRMRDRKPCMQLLPFHGEFPGKLLTGAVLCWRAGRGRRLQAEIQRLVADLAEVQDRDGYLGPFPKAERLTGRDTNGGYLWDVWGHYHCMLGLLLWYQETGDRAALDTCLKSADLLCRTFLGTGRRVYDAGAREYNMAVIHIFCLLYEQTGEQRYLKMARQIEQEWQQPPAGDYLRTALEGKEFFETPKPRWESLYGVQALAELHFITGENNYRQAFEHIWHSILRYDRHNTGAFSSRARAVGNPYDPGAIETCATVTWIALGIDMLRLTGRSTVADELELSTFNAMFGAQAPSGRWWTYRTPMDGQRRAFYDDYNQQCLPGAPEVSCCSTNAARGLGMLTQWAVMKDPEGIVVNYYGPGTFAVAAPSAEPVTLVQETEYPLEGSIALTVMPKRAERFALKLRIPQWARGTTVSVNGERTRKASPGAYLSLERTWEKGDVIRLKLGMPFHFWAGEKECDGLTSIYRGPLLLAYDQRYNTMDPHDVPALDAERLSPTPVSVTKQPVPWLMLRFKATDGRDLMLCDFASAGAAGNHYRSWLPVQNVPEQGFSFGGPH